jgi:hypothetical protein
MKTMIILRGQSKYSQRSTFEIGAIVGISWAEKSLDGEISSLDPDFFCFVDLVEDYVATVGGRHHNVEVIWRSAWTSIWFQLSIEEFIESNFSTGESRGDTFCILQWEEGLQTYRVDGNQRIL